MVYPEELDDIDILAHTVYGEARNETVQVQAAIAWVIRNRLAKRGNPWGKTIKEVCLKPYEFSCWNFGEVNRQTLLNLQTHDELYGKIRRVVENVLDGTLSDNTKDSTHYHDKQSKPSWKRGKVPAVTIENRLFYNTIY